MCDKCLPIRKGLVQPISSIDPIAYAHLPGYGLEDAKGFLDAEPLVVRNQDEVYTGPSFSDGD